MLQNSRSKVLIAFTVVLLLITSAFYTTRTQNVDTNDAIRTVKAWKIESLKGGHWVHLIYTVTSHEKNGIVLPDGQPMPSSYINDDWYFLNEAGLVAKGVFTMKDFDGNILQQSAYRNDIQVNFTFDDRQEAVQPYPLNIDLGFEAYLQDAERKGMSINKFDGDLDGKPVFSYSYVENLKLPTQLSGEDVIVDSLAIKGTFDQETGNLLQIQTILNLENGSSVVYETASIIGIESLPNANDEILGLLEVVK